MPHPSPRVCAYGIALLVALALAGDLLWMPVEVSDSLGEILDAQQSPSVWASFTGKFGTDSYLRPLRIAQIKALYDLAQDQHYWLVYRGFHALLAIAVLLLFTRALRVSTTVDVAAAAFAIVVLVGLYTFRGTVREAFPINHFLEMLVLCLVALNLAQSRGGLWVDLAAALTFVVAALTLESGLLVWFVAAAAWAVGWRGISARGLVVMTALLLGYAYLRFIYLSTGVPTLIERSAGYLLEVLDPADLQQRFGAQPLWFYGYNVLASISAVLFSEPQDGVFVMVASWLRGGQLPRVVLPVVTSIVTTAVLIWAAARRASRPYPPSQGYGGAGVFDDTARLIIIFLVVLAGNAALSFAYAQDEIMSVAGAFYALAAFGAIREAMLAASRGGLLVRAVGAVLLCTLAVAWTIRSVGVHYVLRSQATKHQNDWVVLPYALQRNGDWPSDPATERLILRLRRDAIELRVPNIRVDEPEWPGRLWLE